MVSAANMPSPSLGFDSNSSQNFFHKKLIFFVNLFNLVNFLLRFEWNEIFLNEKKIPKKI